MLTGTQFEAAEPTTHPALVHPCVLQLNLAYPRPDPIHTHVNWCYYLVKPSPGCHVYQQEPQPSNSVSMVPLQGLLPALHFVLCQEVLLLA